MKGRGMRMGMEEIGVGKRIEEEICDDGDI